MRRTLADYFRPYNQRLEEYLGIPLGQIIVRPDAVDRWKKDDGVTYFDFFETAMDEFGYVRP